MLVTSFDSRSDCFVSSVKRYFKKKKIKKKITFGNDRRVFDSYGNVALKCVRTDTTGDVSGSFRCRLLFLMTSPPIDS